MKILDCASLSIQNGRTSNDDRALSMVLNHTGEYTDTSALFAVFDGMGGNNRFDPEAGRFSSRFAEQSICRELLHFLAEAAYRPPHSEEAVHTALSAALLRADQSLYQQDTVYGTTASIGMVLGDTLFCTNAGDSPICLLHHRPEDGKTEVIRLYEQQNYAGFGMPDGWPDTEEFARQKQVGSSYILRQFVGGNNVEHCPAFTQKLSPGDILLLGSDGALARFTREELCTAANSALDMQNLIFTLRQKAISEKEEQDNLTLIAVQFGA